MLLGERSVRDRHDGDHFGQVVDLAANALGADCFIWTIRIKIKSTGHNVNKTCGMVAYRR